MQMEEDENSYQFFGSGKLWVLKVEESRLCRHSGELRMRERSATFIFFFFWSPIKSKSVAS
jgi:hypothetical protein